MRTSGGNCRSLTLASAKQASAYCGLDRAVSARLARIEVQDGQFRRLHARSSAGARPRRAWRCALRIWRDPHQSARSIRTGSACRCGQLHGKEFPTTTWSIRMPRELALEFAPPLSDHQNTNLADALGWSLSQLCEGAEWDPVSAYGGVWRSTALDKETAHDRKNVRRGDRRAGTPRSAAPC